MLASGCLHCAFRISFPHWKIKCSQLCISLHLQYQPNILVKYNFELGKNPNLCFIAEWTCLCFWILVLSPGEHLFTMSFMFCLILQDPDGTETILPFLNCRYTNCIHATWKMYSDLNLPKWRNSLVLQLCWSWGGKLSSVPGCRHWLLPSVKKRQKTEATGISNKQAVFILTYKDYTLNTVKKCINLISERTS